MAAQSWQGGRAQQPVARRAADRHLLDINERKSTEARPRLLASVFRYAQEGIMITDADGRILEVRTATMTSPAIRVRRWWASHLTCCRRKAALTRPSARPCAMPCTAMDTGAAKSSIAGPTVNCFIKHLSLTSVHDAGGQIVNYIGIFTDISQIKAQQEKLERLARYDMLTGLPNRTCWPTG